MRIRLSVAAAALLIAAAAPAALATTPVRQDAASPSGSAVSGTTGATRVVPPPAPSPTDTGRSPELPDPHPQRGGIGPSDQAVGGKALLSRSLVVPRGVHALPHDLTARAFVLADLDTGDIIAARDPHGRYQAASIQKLLTSVTLLPLLPGNRVVTVSRRAANIEGSHAGLVGGGRYTIDDIFRGLLLVSGNDSAEALAEAAGGRAKTVTMMNTEATHLGGYDTFVQTPSGLDGWQQLTSAYDMTLFLRAAANQPRLIAYDTVDKATLPAQHVDGFAKVTLYNQNTDFLHTVKGAMLAKTGFTDAAQHTFAGVIERNGHRYGVIMLRAQRYPDDQWVQATKLVDWGLRLPRGTAPVGHLTGPVDGVVSGVRAVSTTSNAASGSPTTSPSTSPGSSSSATGGARLLLIAVVFGVLLLLSQRIRRRAHPRRGDEPSLFTLPRRSGPKRPPPRRGPKQAPPEQDLDPPPPPLQ